MEENPGAAAVSAGGFARFDLPRNRQNTALLGDPCNDENLIVSQLHTSMLRFHNAVVDHVKNDPDWTPTLPSASPDTFQITDLLRFAGVVASL